jgi:hypothetical protein
MKKSDYVVSLLLLTLDLALIVILFILLLCSTIICSYLFPNKIIRILKFFSSLLAYVFTKKCDIFATQIGKQDSSAPVEKDSSAPILLLCSTIICSYLFPVYCIFSSIACLSFLFLNIA